MANKNNNIVVLFDFDKTIIDVDSDNWVVDELGFTDLFEQLLPTMPWNSLMDRMMKELHDHGKTIEEITTHRWASGRKDFGLRVQFPILPGSNPHGCKHLKWPPQKFNMGNAASRIHACRLRDARRGLVWPIWAGIPGSSKKKKKKKTIEEIKQVLRRIPIHPRVIPAIKSAHALGCELRIVSDANTFFIETIVEHLGIREYFSEINTNPGLVDEQGRLRISPYHDFSKSSHGCSRCPPNMCKGLIIERIQASFTKEGNKMKMIYLGDGAGDYCPSLKLKAEDYMMPRKNFPVWDLISQNPMLVKATVRDWTDGEALERILMGIINEIISSDEEKEKMLSSDHYKISVGIVHEPLLPLALQVPLSLVK